MRAEIYRLMPCEHILLLYRERLLLHRGVVRCLKIRNDSEDSLGIVVLLRIGLRRTQRILVRCGLRLRHRCGLRSWSFGLVLCDHASSACHHDKQRCDEAANSSTSSHYPPPNTKRYPFDEARPQSVASASGNIDSARMTEYRADGRILSHSAALAANVSITAMFCINSDGMPWRSCR